jgi:hypothetical protein
MTLALNAQVWLPRKCWTRISYGAAWKFLTTFFFFFFTQPCCITCYIYTQPYTTNQPTYIRRSIYIPAVRRVSRTSSPPPQAPAGIKSPDAGRRHGLRVSSAVINFGGLANPRFSHSRKEFRASAVLPAPTAAAALRPKTGSDRPSACQSCDIYDDTTGWQLSSTSNCKISATRAKHFPSNFRT